MGPCSLGCVLPKNTSRFPMLIEAIKRKLYSAITRLCEVSWMFSKGRKRISLKTGSYHFTKCSLSSWLALLIEWHNLCPLNTLLIGGFFDPLFSLLSIAKNVRPQLIPALTSRFSFYYNLYQCLIWMTMGRNRGDLFCWCRNMIWRKLCLKQSEGETVHIIGFDVFHPITLYSLGTAEWISNVQGVLWWPF